MDWESIKRVDKKWPEGDCGWKGDFRFQDTGCEAAAEGCLGIQSHSLRGRALGWRASQCKAGDWGGGCPRHSKYTFHNGKCQNETFCDYSQICKNVNLKCCIKYSYMHRIQLRTGFFLSLLNVTKKCRLGINIIIDHGLYVVHSRVAAGGMRNLNLWLQKCDSSAGGTRTLLAGCRATRGLDIRTQPQTPHVGEESRLASGWVCRTA